MILLDMHALVWSLLRPELLSRAARESLGTASAWGVSGATPYEMRRRHRIGKWPEIAALVEKSWSLPGARSGARSPTARSGYAVFHRTLATVVCIGPLARQRRRSKRQPRIPPSRSKDPRRGRPGVRDS